MLVMVVTAKTALKLVNKVATSPSAMVLPEKSISKVVKFNPVKVGKVTTSTPVALMVKVTRVESALAKMVPKLGILSVEKSISSKAMVKVVTETGAVAMLPKQVARSAAEAGATWMSIT